MSVESVLQRVAALEQTLSNPAALLAASARTGGTAAPAAALQTAAEPAAASGGPSFAEALQNASAGYNDAPTPSGTIATYTGPSTVPAYLGAPSTAALTPTLGASGAGGSIGERIVAIAESQAGQTEQPPGSNESPAIAQYRSATAGALPGAPWCAYFASWAARQAGAPLGAQGEGLGSAAQIWSWAQSTGRAVPNGPGVVPRPGDLIVFGDEHVGIVKDVLPDGDIQTIEGNYENKVALNVRTPSEASGYVSMG
jgi:hypothetical protein